MDEAMLFGCLLNDEWRDLMELAIIIKNMLLGVSNQDRTQAARLYAQFVNKLDSLEPSVRQYLFDKFPGDGSIAPLVLMRVHIVTRSSMYAPLPLYMQYQPTLR